MVSGGYMIAANQAVGGCRIWERGVVADGLSVGGGDNPDEAPPAAGMGETSPEYVAADAVINRVPAGGGSTGLLVARWGGRMRDRRCIRQTGAVWACVGAAVRQRRGRTRRQ